ncbi:MAG: class I SAM-dependent methyltransferase [Syntrophales bacterium]|nr:class I SAM-dependent methyltransferase [Syntrophales bacterium]
MSYLFVLFFSAVGTLLLVKMLFVFSILIALPITGGAMFHPSAGIRVKTFLDRMPMKKGELLIDIGCGDGRVLLEANKRYGVRALGYEVNPFAYFLSRIRAAGIPNVEVRWRDFWKEDLSGADVVFCYLFPDVMERLGQKLSSELRPGTRVISCNFPIPGWKPIDVAFPPSSLHGDPIYFYEVGKI